MHQNEILHAPYHCYMKDHQLFLVTVKAGCINEDISGMITQNYIKIIFSLESFLITYRMLHDIFMTDS